MLALSSLLAFQKLLHNKGAALGQVHGGHVVQFYLQWRWGPKAGLSRTIIPGYVKATDSGLFLQASFSVLIPA